MVNDNRYLERRSLGWYAVVEVPPSLRSKIGKKRLKRSLKTRELSLAKLRRFPVVAEFKAIIAKAEREGTGNEALEWRRAIAEEQDPEQRDLIGLVLEDRAEEIEKRDGFPVAKAFYDFASGQSTPLTFHRDQWLAESTYTERTKGDHRHALALLEEWLKGDGKVPALEAVTDAVAVAFRKAVFDQGTHRKTLNKALSSLRSYWRWLTAQGFAFRNPWLGKSLPKGRVSGEDRERPFTDEEMVKLFAGKADTTTRDVMTIAALSGMRIEEIFQLRMRDCDDGFSIRKSKTAAGERRVPIHPKLKAIIARRCKAPEQDRDAFLIAEAEATGWDGARAMAFSKRFTTYRKACGVDEKREGERRSKVNFHSFRRWFATKAEQAGCSETLVARVMGHKVQSMTFGVYSGGASREQLEAVVKSVKLPKDVKL